MFIFWQKFLNQLKDKGNIPLLIWVLRMGNSTIAYLYFDTDFIIADWLLTDSARTTVAWTKFGLLIFSSVFFQTTGPIPTKLETTGETLPVWPPKRKEDLEGKLIFHIIMILICLAKPSMRVRTAGAIFWIYLGIFRDYGLRNIFFRNKTFLFFKIEKWNRSL